MASVFDVYCTEIDSEDIEGSVGGTLEDTCQSTNERVGSEGLHSIYHHASRTATREGFHYRCRESIDESGVETTSADSPFCPIDYHFHSSRSAKNADSNEDCDEIRDDSHRCLEAILCTFDKGIIDIDLLSHASHDETDDYCHQKDSGNGGADLVHHLRFHLREAPYYAAHSSTSASKSNHHGAIEEVYLLVNGGYDDAGEGGNKGGKEDWNKDISRLLRAHLRPIGHDTDRDDGQSGGVEHEEHNHRIGRCGILSCYDSIYRFTFYLTRSICLLAKSFIFSHIELLHLLHCL